MAWARYGRGRMWIPVAEKGDYNQYNKWKLNPWRNSTSPTTSKQPSVPRSKPFAGSIHSLAWQSTWMGPVPLTTTTLHSHESVRRAMGGIIGSSDPRMANRLHSVSRRATAYRLTDPIGL